MGAQIGFWALIDYCAGISQNNSYVLDARPLAWAYAPSGRALMPLLLSAPANFSMNSRPFDRRGTSYGGSTSVKLLRAICLATVFPRKSFSEELRATSWNCCLPSFGCYPASNEPRACCPASRASKVLSTIMLHRVRPCLMRCNSSPFCRTL